MSSIPRTSHEGSRKFLAVPTLTKELRQYIQPESDFSKWLLVRDFHIHRRIQNFKLWEPQPKARFVDQAKEIHTLCTLTNNRLLEFKKIPGKLSQTDLNRIQWSYLFGTEHEKYKQYIHDMDWSQR